MCKSTVWSGAKAIGVQTCEPYEGVAYGKLQKEKRGMNRVFRAIPRILSDKLNGND
jgi:hypothetical protein